jgi:hypothetical protein
VTVGETSIVLAHALVGWALYGATMAISLAKISLNRALTIHAVAAPGIVTAVSAIYFTYFADTGALATALIFVAVVIAMDFFVVALLIQHDAAMFSSFPGTWLPFALIFASTYLVGLLSQ